MADGLCTEDAVNNSARKTLLLAKTAKEYKSTACVVGHQRSTSNSANVKSFYLDNSDCGKLCGGSKVCARKNNGYATTKSPTTMDEAAQILDDCRKKRCSDRYDSSESSDSGVATLSCTDYSGSSTASSDITDPGSPFSTASSHSEDSASQPSKMAPNVTAHHPPWPWSGSDSPPLKRSANVASNSVTATATSTDKTASSKRLKLDVNLSTNIPDAAKKKQSIPQQGKITEYFKSQMKSNGIKKEISTNLQKYFTILNQPKVILNNKCTKLPSDLYRNVRAVAVTAPMKKVILDTKTKKISQVIAIPRKILPAPKPDKNKTSGSTASMKLTVLDGVYLATKVRSASTPNNFKINSTVVPIVKLNPMPSKLLSNGVDVAARPKSPAVAAECPTAQVKPDTDSDSGVSVRELLSVAVAVSSAAAVAEPPQKSPILSQPKTIRFPAKQASAEQHKEPDATDSGLCRWSECQAHFDTSGALLEHLQIKHVISQATQEHYVCLWLGCKVHGRTSCSRSWLERHVLSHAGNKPFRCIVDGCGCRFNSQQTLERHVNSHFNSTENGSNGSSRKSVESGSTKLFKRNGKKLRYRRQPWSARMFDFFDAGIMEGLQHRLVTMTEKRTAGEIHKAPGDTVTLQSRVLASRTESDGRKKLLLRWYPPDIIADEWMLESESQRSKTVFIPTLEPPALDALNNSLFPTRREPSSPSAQLQSQLHTQPGTSVQSHRQKHCRKRVAKSS